MAEARLGLETEVQEILKCIDSHRNFLLSGGAGSGKTFSLVQVIRQVIGENPTSKVACMTYTNAAVREIEQRVNHSNLNVSTIHDFLWDNIKHFQKELKRTIVALSNNPDVEQIVVDESPIPESYFDKLEEGIQYKEYLKLREGIISHDELLIVAKDVFEKYPRLIDIIKDKYKFIFIDEYQDTNKGVIEIFLTHFPKSKKRNVIGFFGDSMQSIYDDTIGNLKEYIGEEENKVKEVKKEQNRRNPLAIITLANKLRNDDIKQQPSKDAKAPNMIDGEIKQGGIVFIHSKNNDTERVKEKLIEEYGWNFMNPKEAKELNLTHNLIAEKAGFRNLMDIYDDDQILKYRTRIKKYIKDNNVQDDFSDKTLDEVLIILKNGKTGKDLKDIEPTPTMKTFIDDHVELYREVLAMNYSKFVKTYAHKDQLLDDKKQNEEDENRKGSKRDSLIKHLFRIQSNIILYEENKINEFLKVTDYRIKIVRSTDKAVLKENIESLRDVKEETIGEIIQKAHDYGICLIDDRLNDFKDRNQYLYNRVTNVKFSEFQKLFEYLEGKTPFSTQHKTKGAEYDNVLVILDNGGWNKYNFKYLFLGNGTESVLERTQKIFYVCCTRAKEKLAIFYFKPEENVIKRAKEWFGEDSVIEL